MTETPPDKTKFGTLLYPRFFGPSVEYESSFYHKYLYITLAIIGTGLFLATGILLLSGTGISGQATLNILIALGIPVLYLIMYRRAATSMEYEFMLRRGELDWDLYENGFLTREYSGDGPGHVRTAFVGFDVFSRAFVNINEQNAREVWELVKASPKLAKRELDGGFKGIGLDWDGANRAAVAGRIWLVGRQTGTADFELQRDLLRDPERFESTLREKIKEVE